MPLLPSRFKPSQCRCLLQRTLLSMLVLSLGDKCRCCRPASNHRMPFSRFAVACAGCPPPAHRLFPLLPLVLLILP